MSKLLESEVLYTESGIIALIRMSESGKEAKNGNIEVQHETQQGNVYMNGEAQSSRVG